MTSSGESAVSHPTWSGCDENARSTRTASPSPAATDTQSVTTTPALSKT